MTRVPRPFPATRRSVVRDLADDQKDVRDRAFDHLVAAYWRPVYTYLRRSKGVEPADAEDLTQGFFAHAFERGTLDSFDPTRARFRTWVRTCLDGFVANERKAAGRLKRGGGYRHVPLDIEPDDGEPKRVEIRSDEDLETFFHREWMRELLTSAVEELRADSDQQGRVLEFALFAECDLVDDDERPSYQDLARRHGVDVVKVTNTLHAMRRRLRDTVEARLRAISATEDEFLSEYRGLFGGKV